jgi:hypothetical protein
MRQVLLLLRREDVVIGSSDVYNRGGRGGLEDSTETNSQRCVGIWPARQSAGCCRMTLG